MNKKPYHQGFTLLEMMIALGILSVSYIALMQTQSASIRLGTYGRQVSVATFLAQAKMEEMEEELFSEGFPDMDKNEEGDFDEQGFPDFKFTIEINKIELPIAEAFTEMMSNMTGGEGTEQTGGLASILGAKLGTQAGRAGGPNTAAASGMMNPDMMTGQMSMMSDMLEQSLRELRCKVWWGQGGEGYEMEIVTHVVRVPQAAPGAGRMPTRQPANSP